MKLFFGYLRQRRNDLILALSFIIIFLVIFAMYHLPVKAVVYPSVICLVIGISYLCCDFLKVYKRHRRLEEVKSFTAAMISELPQTDNIECEDYREIILKLKAELEQLQTTMNNRYTDMNDYYTTWVHQIKTPIASMKLLLENEDTVLSRKLSSELLRIEQYVEMVLVFLRLDSKTTDYVIKEYDVDDIIRQAVRRFAGEFIARKLTLIYEPVNYKVVTDEKWFSFCIGQVLSNALKYTRNGYIKIYMQGDILCIEDSGIGIAPEDLPRIFEKGYTGYNGRSDKKASGIGLYLCRNICSRLGHVITASSEVDKGTVIYINLKQKKTQYE